MPQFRAESGVQYKNAATGQTVSFTADQLKDNATGWLSSGFQKVAAPSVPEPAPVLSTKDLTAAPAPAAVQEASKMGTFVSYDKLTGKVDVKSRTASAISDYDPETQLLEQRIPNPTELQSGRWVVTNKVGKDYYGVLKPQVTPPPAPPGTPGNTGAPAGTPAGGATTPAAQAATIWEQYQGGLAGPNQQLTQAQQTANTIKGELDKMRNETDFGNLLETAAAGKIKKEALGLKADYQKGVTDIENKPIPMTDINNQIARLLEVTNRAIGALGDQLEGMNIDKAITDATNVYKYNSKLIEYQVAQGNVAAAQSMVQQTAQDFWQFQNLQIQLLERQDKIDAQTATALQSQAEMELGLATNGYTEISAAAAAQYGPDRKWTNPVTGKTYLKPDPNVSPEFAGNMMEKYPDAGILPTDTVTAVQEKLQKSRIYQQQTRLAGGGSGGSSGGSSGGGIYTPATGSGGNKASSDAIAASLNSILPRLTSQQAKAATAQVNSLLQSGDMEGAKQAITSLAISSLPTEQQNKAFGRFAAIDSLNDIKVALNEYAQAGGNTGILTGTDEDIYQKLGATTDPNLAQIGNKITMALIAYRNAVSGAAFTESEAKVYNNLFPSIGKTNTLNQAKIDSLISTFNLNNKSALSLVIGSNNYDQLYGGTVSAPSVAATPDEQWSTIVGSTQNNTPSTPEQSSGGFFSRAAGWILNLFN
jgi:hypothetical protein